MIRGFRDSGKLALFVEGTSRSNYKQRRDRRTRITRDVRDEIGVRVIRVNIFFRSFHVI